MRAILLPLLAAALIAAPAKASAQSPADSAATKGRTLFEGKGLCFSCHGKGGEGALGPTTRLAGRPLVHTKPTIDDISSLIKSGVDSAHSRSGQVMPARGGSRLTDEEVAAVAAYVVQLQRNSKPGSP